MEKDEERCEVEAEAKLAAERASQCGGAAVEAEAVEAEREGQQGWLAAALGVAVLPSSESSVRTCLTPVWCPSTRTAALCSSLLGGRSVGV